MATLANYIASTRRTLRDESTGNVYSDTDLTAWINEAMQHRDLDLRINRMLYSFTLTAGVFRYSFDSVISGGTKLIGAAGVTPVDIYSLVLMPLGDANSTTRYPMGRWPYSELTVLLARNYPSYPIAYSIFGPSTFVLGPPPANGYPVEVDFFGYSSPLVNPTDIDPVPYPWTNSIPFYAAYLAKMQSQRFDEADRFYQRYQEKIGLARSGGRPLAVRNPLSNLSRRGFR